MARENSTTSTIARTGTTQPHAQLNRTHRHRLTTQGEPGGNRNILLLKGPGEAGSA